MAQRKPPASCDVAGLDDVDIGTVEALARLALDLRREGATITLHGASIELRSLIGLCGLARVLASDDDPAPPSAQLSPGAPAARRAGRSARCRGRT